jgi:hypothetical protein
VEDELMGILAQTAFPSEFSVTKDHCIDDPSLKMRVIEDGYFLPANEKNSHIPISS